MAEPFYDELAEVYDRMIRWERRLAFEGPLFEALWRERGIRRVLDAACGSGGHLPMWAAQGVEVTAADGSGQMLEVARQRIAALEPARRPRLIQSTWSQLAEKVPETFDAVLCLGNSLPYVTGPVELGRSLKGLWSCVAPGGLLLLQLKNFERMRRTGERFLPLSTCSDAVGEQIAIRQYHWGERTVEFMVLLLSRPAAEVSTGWTLRHWTTTLATWGADDIEPVLSGLGARIERLGSLGREPFDVQASEDLVIWAIRTG